MLASRHTFQAIVSQEASTLAGIWKVTPRIYARPAVGDCSTSECPTNHVLPPYKVHISPAHVCTHVRRMYLSSFVRNAAILKMLFEGSSIRRLSFSLCRLWFLPLLLAPHCSSMQSLACTPRPGGSQYGPRYCYNKPSKSPRNTCSECPKAAKMAHY